RDGRRASLTEPEKPMAPVKIDPAKVRAFKDAATFYTWLSKRHDKDDEVWIKIHKVDSGLKSITAKEAIDGVLCWGWIDGVRKGFDDKSFLQRYSPRSKKSNLEQDQRRQRRAAHQGREDDRARAEAGRGRQGRRALGPRLQGRQGHEDPRRSSV